jgi:hypothetical protein
MQTAEACCIIDAVKTNMHTPLDAVVVMWRTLYASKLDNTQSAVLAVRTRTKEQ